MTTLGDAGIPCGRIRDIAQVCTNPQLTERGKVIEQPHPSAGTVRSIGQPIELSETPGTMRHPPPRLGEHTDEILRGIAFSDAEIEAFRRNGIV